MRLWLAAAALLLASCTTTGPGSIVLREQGSFAVGGTVITAPGAYDQAQPTAAGQTLHGDHAYVFYQIPANARPLPLVMWHGNGQFSKTWETTPDGREGFQNIFLRLGYPVYLLDQPRRGRAARSTVPYQLAAQPDEQQWFDTFRVGHWPDYFPDVQFSRDPAVLDQYFRQMTPDTGPFDLDVLARAGSALFDRIGPGVLVTHSRSGGPGWQTVILNENVRGIVAYEPGSNFPFPPGEVPEPIPNAAGPFSANEVPLDSFLRLTRIPIVIYYGDFIPEQPTVNRGQDLWRARRAMARLWIAAVNRHGGDATLVELPALGIHGNTHFPFSDLNNLEIADLMADFLAENGLD